MFCSCIWIIYARFYSFYLNTSSINISETFSSVILNMVFYVNDAQSLYLKCCLRIFGPKAVHIRHSGWFSGFIASVCICEWAFMAHRFCFSREGKRKIREKNRTRPPWALTFKKNVHTSLVFFPTWSLDPGPLRVWENVTVWRFYALKCRNLGLAEADYKVLCSVTDYRFPFDTSVSCTVSCFNSVTVPKASHIYLL